MKDPIKPTSASLQYGILLNLSGWIFLTVLIALSRDMGVDTNIPMVLFFQNIVGLVLISPWIVLKGKSALSLQKWKWFSIRTLAGYLNLAFIFLAIQNISFVNTMLLNNTAAFFIPLIIWVWRKILLSYKLWVGIILGFAGIGFILKPDIGILNIGFLYGLCSAFCFAFSMIAQRRLIKTENIYTVLFYYFLVGTLLSLPLALSYWKLPNGEVTFKLLIIGLLFFVSQFVFLSSFRFAMPSVLSAFNYSSVVFAAILEWLIWNQFPDFLSILGIILVCLGGILSMRYGVPKDTPPNT